MKKSLISKIALALVLVSASTQAFGGTWNDWFNKNKIVKGTFVAAATLIPASIVPAVLTLWDIYLADKKLLNNGAQLLTMFGKNCLAGAGTGFASYLLAKNYPAEYCVGLTVTAVSIASLYGILHIPGVIVK